MGRARRGDAAPARMVGTKRISNLVFCEMASLMCLLVTADASDVESLTASERREMLNALTSTRGFYSAPRAAQLSGVPARTVYHWANEGILIPDHGASRPKAWSYRDLVFLRLMAYLRSNKVALFDSAALTAAYRDTFDRSTIEEVETRITASTGAYALGTEMREDALTGQGVLDTMVSIAGHFDLLAALDPKTNVKRLRGPHLVRPSARTSMSPWVMSGEPVIRNSRITTAALVALHEERKLESADIVALYPSLSVGDVEDAIGLESRLRHAA